MPCRNQIWDHHILFVDEFSKSHIPGNSCGFSNYQWDVGYNSFPIWMNSKQLKWIQYLHALILTNGTLWTKKKLVQNNFVMNFPTSCENMTDGWSSRKIHPILTIYKINPKSMKENLSISNCNQLDLQSLGSQPTSMPRNLPDHWVCLSFRSVAVDFANCKKLKNRRKKNSIFWYPVPVEACLSEFLGGSLETSFQDSMKATKDRDPWHDRRKGSIWQLAPLNAHAIMRLLLKPQFAWFDSHHS